MKHIIIIIAIFGTVLFMTGCADLDETLRSGITAQNHYTTASGFEDLAASMYWPLQTMYGNWHNMWDHGTDIFTVGSGARPHLDTYEADLNPSMTSRNWYDIFIDFYKGINYCNSVIERAKDVEDMSEARKKVLVAEAHFLRAHYYHILVQTFGRIHLVLEETKGVITEAYPTPAEEVWPVIIEDLEHAAANLPVVPAQPARATAGAAKHLLARVNLYKKDYPEAAKWAVELINSGTYELIPSYYTLWDPYLPHSGKSLNKETIFAMLITPNSQPDNRDTKARRYSARTRTYPGMQSTYYIGNEVSRHRPTTFLVHQIFNNDPDRTDVPNQWNDERWSTSFKIVWFYNNPRTLPAGRSLGDTAIFLPTEKKFDLMTTAEANAFTGGRYQMFRTSQWRTEVWPSAPLKFRMKGDDTPEQSLATLVNYHPDYHWRTEPIYRLAETYLIAAEAYMYMGGAANLQTAANYFNTVRKRAEATGYTIPLITPAELNIDEILNERHRELIGEYQTWTDLQRTGKLISRVRQYNTFAAPYIQDHHALRPIPQPFLDLLSNKDDFPQNPGY